MSGIMHLKVKKTSTSQPFQTQFNKSVLGTYGRFPLTIVKGKGSLLWDDTGKSYLDFVSGLAVNNLGHAHPQILKSISHQAKKLIHVSNLYYNQPQGELASNLTKLTGLKKAFFCNSGAEANEAAIKFVRHASIELTHQKDRVEIIAVHNSFHGRTLGAISATMQSKYQEGFGPLVSGFKKVPFGNLEAIKKAITPKTCAILT